MRRAVIVGVVALLVAFGLSVLSRGQAKETANPAPGTEDKGHGTQDKGPRDKGRGAETPGVRLEVPPPPFSDGIFPCTQCHNKDLPPNRTRRELSMHADIELKHDTEHRWCLDCHDADNRDQLHLASGEPVPFAQSYQLCGQCHGEKYRDWRAGVHGRRVGQWNGAKQYLLCVHCHSPHQPHFKSMAPQPAPFRPRRPQ